jgi:hypothetical protein
MSIGVLLESPRTPYLTQSRDLGNRAETAASNYTGAQFACRKLP